MKSGNVYTTKAENVILRQTAFATALATTLGTGWKGKGSLISPWYYNGWMMQNVLWRQKSIRTVLKDVLIWLVPKQFKQSWYRKAFLNLHVVRMTSANPSSSGKQGWNGSLVCEMAPRKIAILHLWPLYVCLRLVHQYPPSPTLPPTYRNENNADKCVKKGSKQKGALHFLSDFY